MMKLNSIVQRRQQHVGVLSDGIWTAHGRDDGPATKGSLRYQ